MTCDRCGSPCKGRLCSGCMALERQEQLGVPDDHFDACEGCGVDLRDARSQRLPDGSSYILCEDCREGARRMWAVFKLKQPQQANRVRAQANIDRRDGQRHLFGGVR